MFPRQYASQYILMNCYCQYHFTVFISHFSFVWIVRSDINVFDPSPRISKHFAEKSLQPFSSQHLDVFHSKLRVRFFRDQTAYALYLLEAGG